MLVSVVIVTFNRLSLLKENLQHLLKQTHKVDKIFVINNNSTDGTTEYLNDISNEKIFAINSDKNLGGAGGFSYGLKMAYEKSNSEFFWIMDDDTMPSDNALSKLIISAERLHNNFGFLCSNVRWWKDNSSCNLPKLSENWGKIASDGLIKVSHATFVSIMLSRKMIDEVGFPIGDMFIWGDDTEYTKRLSSNADSYFVCDSIVEHKTSSNRSLENIYNADRNRIHYYSYMYRNLLYIDRKLYNNKKYFKDIFRFLLIIFRIPCKANNYRIIRIQSMIKGIFHGVRFNPVVDYPESKG
ncbi:glycosyltransferase family 2 protein [Apilactobacillus timberlakei]|uniref:glycosyltransferase family 2 protein n=1 Tax=Apilactobacillus timberlakei TaxID=2008380 RepID=UPI001128EE26|nr:glycosyltransferase family 2 protein [Apilactobacillus timberlakei]TPR14813.1 glycosyltransferase [Apilactobacillus timberlakei]